MAHVLLSGSNKASSIQKNTNPLIREKHMPDDVPCMCALDWKQYVFLAQPIRNTLQYSDLSSIQFHDYHFLTPQPLTEIKRISFINFETGVWLICCFGISNTCTPRICFLFCTVRTILLEWSLSTIRPPLIPHIYFKKRLHFSIHSLFTNYIYIYIYIFNALSVPCWTLAP